MEVPLVGSRGKAPVEDLEDEVPSEAEAFLNFE